MTVTFYEDGRFWVSSSENRKRLYLVDVMEFDGKGKCDCMDFAVRREPKLEAGVRVGPCKHIRAVVKWLGKRVVLKIPKSNRRRLQSLEELGRLVIERMK